MPVMLRMGVDHRGQPTMSANEPSRPEYTCKIHDHRYRNVKQPSRHDRSGSIRDRAKKEGTRKRGRQLERRLADVHQGTWDGLQQDGGPAPSRPEAEHQKAAKKK